MRTGQQWREEWLKRFAFDIDSDSGSYISLIFRDFVEAEQELARKAGEIRALEQTVAAYRADRLALVDRIDELQRQVDELQEAYYYGGTDESNQS